MEELSFSNFRFDLNLIKICKINHSNFQVNSSNVRSSSAKRQTIEYGKDVNCAIASPTGSSVVIASLENIVIFSLENQLWKQDQVIQLSGSHLITSLLWSQDGGKLKKLVGDRHEISFGTSSHHKSARHCDQIEEIPSFKKVQNHLSERFDCQSIKNKVSNCLS